MATSLFDNIFEAEDVRGRPVPNGRVYTYEPGTTTPKVTYSDEDGTIPNTNPVILNSSGKAQIYGDGEYTINVENMFGGQVEGWPKNIWPKVISGGVTLKVNTVDDLRNTPGTHQGDSKEVLGYYEIGDGRGGPIRVWNEGQDPGFYVDNGGSIIVPGDGSAAWLFIDSYTLNAADFGDDITDREIIQNVFDVTPSGGTINLEPNREYVIDAPVNLMANVDWVSGYNASTARTNLTLNFNGATIKFADTVLWSGVFPNHPIWYREVGEELTEVRQPEVIVFGGITGLVVNDATVDGNMFGRGAAQGLPGQLEQEAAMAFKACYDVTINNAVTLDTMGDGINIGYPYTTGGPSSFRGVNSLDGLCQRVTVNGHKAYRHSRLGIAVVGAQDCDFNDIYGEDIFSVDDYKSLAGPGATIDLEADVALSYYTGSGFSAVDNIRMDGVTANNNTFSGAAQVQNARQVTINNVRVFGKAIFAAGRFEGNADGINGARSVVIDGVDLYLDPVGNGMIATISGVNVTMKNVRIHGTPAMNKLIDFLGEGSGCSVSDITGNIQFADSTGDMFRVNEGGVSVKVSDVDIVYDALSVISNPIFVGDGSSIEIDGLCIESARSVDLYNPSFNRGLVFFNGTGSTASLKNIDIGGKSRSLASQLTGTSVNKLYINNGMIADIKTFPTQEKLSVIDICNFEVESFSNSGLSTDAMLYLNLKNSQEISLCDIRLRGDGGFSTNRSFNGVVYTTDEASMFFTGTTIRQENIEFVGGRQSDGTINIIALIQGIPTTVLWSSSAAFNQFKTSAIKMNNFGYAKFIVPSGSSVYNLQLSLTQDGLLPSENVSIIQTSTGLGSLTYSTEAAKNNTTVDPLWVTMNFSGSTGADIEFRLIHH